MSQTRKIRKPSLITDTSMVCFTVASVAFGAALIGTVVNYFLAGWLQAGGMMAVGLLYMGMGFFYLGVKDPVVAKSSEDVDLKSATAVPKTWRREASEDLVGTGAGRSERFESQEAEGELVESGRN